MTIFALIDCNNFYASCEKIFVPSLRDKPVIVLSNNDGCIVARSNEAKALGIKMAVPYFEAEHIIKKHNVKVFSSNYALYADMSKRVMSILSQFSPDVEQYSIDEAFLSLNGIVKPGYCAHVRNTVMKSTGIPVTIGVAKTKTLAKAANEIAKKDSSLKGVLDISSEEDHSELLKKLPVEDVWGVGFQYAKVLKHYGVFTAYDLTKVSPEWIKKNMSVTGLRTIMELKGTPCIELEEAPPAKKGIMSSRSFGTPVRSLDELGEAVSDYVTLAASKLRKQHSIAEHIYVFIQTNRFKPDEPQYSNGLSYTLPSPTAYTPDLIFYAEELLKKIYKPGYKYKKAGFMLSGIMPEDNVQRSLFGDGNLKKKNRLMNVLDKINLSWGSGTLSMASSGIQQKWQMKRVYCSPRYTTNWNEIPVVKV